MLRYLELKTGYNDDGPAWVAHVKVSRSGRTVYFNGKALKRASGGAGSGNHVDLVTGHEYWVSGVKRDGADRHSSGSGVVMIEEGAVAEYLTAIVASSLDRTRFRVIPDLPGTDAQQFTDLENAVIE